METFTRRSMLVGASTLLTAAGLRASQAQPARPAQGLRGVTRFDRELDMLIDVEAPVETIATGYRWTEGPVWIVEDGGRSGYLLFSDVPANAVFRWTAREGARPFLQPSGLRGPIPAGIREAGANGLAVDASGRLVMADSGTRAIARVDLVTRKKTILADRFERKRFNSCNDVALARGGAIYFTDPPYGLAEGDASPLKELDFNGVFRWRPGGKVDLIDRSLARPNGIALSPGGDRLYVACSDEAAAEIRVYDLDAHGLPLNAGRRFVDFMPELRRGLPGLPDGMKVARSGHLFASAPGGIYVIAPDGRKLGLIATGRAISNCTFGEDRRTLFLTSSDSVARVRLKVAC